MSNLAFRDQAAKAVATVKARMAKNDDLKDSAEALRLLDHKTPLQNLEVLPFRCFPLEYIFGCQGLPQHKVVTLQGPTESNKSSFFWALVRIVLGYGGVGAYFDLENKHNPDLAHAYVGNPAAMANRVAVYHCDSPETFGILFMEFCEQLLKNPELCKRPIIIGVDTLGSVLTAKYVSGIRKGNIDPNYSPAKSTHITQATLMGFVGRYLDRLPVTLIGIQQERKRMETGDVYATGGAFSGYTKSLALRLQRSGYNTTLGVQCPVLRISQEKQSVNLKRDVSIYVPTAYKIVQTGENSFCTFSFQWAYTMVDLLADLPATYTEGLFRVHRDTDTQFTVVLPAEKKQEYPHLVKGLACTRAHWSDIGPKLLANEELATVLRQRLDIPVARVISTPVDARPPLDGSLWLSTDEVNPVPATSEGVADWTAKWMVEVSKEAPAPAVEIDEEPEAPRRGRRKAAATEGSAQAVPATPVDLHSIPVPPIAPPAGITA